MTSSSFHSPHCWEYHLGEYLTHGERTSFQCLEPPSASVASPVIQSWIKTLQRPTSLCLSRCCCCYSLLSPLCSLKTKSHFRTFVFAVPLHPPLKKKKIKSFEFVTILLLCFSVLLFIFFFGQEACRILALPQRMEPPPPALEGEVLTTGPPGKSFAVPFMGTLHGCSLWSPQSISPRALSPWSLPGPH